MFSIIPVDRRQADALEPLGTKSKFWFTAADGRRLLFKAEERGTGEDWAEKVACELAGLLGLPHVHYELAVETSGQTPGVVCASCVPPGQSLAHGNQLLLAADPAYPTDHKRFRVSAHTVDAVAAVVRSLGPPQPAWMGGAPADVTTALDVFAGYLLLDAWVANQDRHHENWGAIRDGAMLSLGPTFDHGASLARNLKDEERHERRTTKDGNRRVGPFARKARSALYADTSEKRPLSTVAAWQAFAKFAPAGATAWLARLAGVNSGTVRDVLARVPPERLSAIAREFTLELLEENHRRLLNGDPE